MSLAAVILAAGASRRMGTPKALLDYRGETFLDRLVGIFGEHCSPVIAVLGHDAERIRGGVRRAPEAVFAVNPDPARGQLSSLQCGLRAAPEDADGALFSPVDQPGVRPATVAELVRMFWASRAPVVAPRHQGRHGHPVIVSRAVIGELLRLETAATARDAIRLHDGAALHVDVEDPAVCEDIDDPAAYRRLLEARP